ncbi:MAG: glucose-6-phosphate 1-epimerase [Limisphaerales bacterium]|jgi:glucose-6-phosphate 1-epimerase
MGSKMMGAQIDPVRSRDFANDLDPGSTSAGVRNRTVTLFEVLILLASGIMSRCFILVLIVIQATQVPLQACVNTRYSRAEEQLVTGDLIKLIMGQFAHHGPQFYEYQLIQTAAELEKNPNDIEARNDRAVAYLKLKRYNEALAEFEKIEAMAPGRYRTHSNLGVLHKKTSEFAKAAQHVEKSLEIQPGGHLGLGDYYLRMIRWLDKVEDMKANEEPVNFLNIPYSKGSAGTAESTVVDREFIKTLIKADRSFPDVYVVLGDVLFEDGELELAYRSYERASKLNHPFFNVIRSRQEAVMVEWKEVADADDGMILANRRWVGDWIRGEIRRAEKWVAQFQQEEAKLLASGKLADFAVIGEQLKASGIEEPEYQLAGLFRGIETNDNAANHRSWLLGSILLGLFVVGVLVIVLMVIRRIVRKLTGVDDPLNQRFGQGNTIKFAKGRGGLMIARIRNEHAEAEVYLHGGHVTSFKPHGQKEILWLSDEAVFEAPKAIRGGVPVCWPWFSAHPENKELPAHGFARNRRWSVHSSQSRADGRTRLTLILRDDAASREIWPHSFELELRILVGTELRLELITRNTGAEPFVVGGALHTYFGIGDISKASIEGLEGHTYLDQLDSLKRVEQDGPIRFAEEVDRIYVDTDDTCTIIDEVQSRRIRVAKEGSQSTVVWNPWIAKAKRMADFNNDGYRTMLCIEATNAGEDLHTVPPGGEHRLMQILSVAK